MSIVTTNVNNLKINILTQAQYDDDVQQGIIGDNELSVITDSPDYQEKTHIVTNSSATVTTTVEDNTITNCTSSSLTSLTLTIPSQIDAAYISQLNFSCTSSVTPTMITAPNTIVWMGDDIDTSGQTPIFVPVTNKRYSILFFTDGLTVNSTGLEVRGLVQGTELPSA